MRGGPKELRPWPNPWRRSSTGNGNLDASCTGSGGPKVPGPECLGYPRAIPTTGWLRRMAPVEPWKWAPVPKVKIPPSAATR